MKLNNPPQINGDQKECQVGTSCGYLFSVTLSVLTDGTDAASQEQSIQKPPSPTWGAQKNLRIVSPPSSIVLINKRRKIFILFICSHACRALI